MLTKKVSSQSLDKEEAQSGSVLLNGARRELLALKQMRLVLPDLLATELIG